MSADRMRSITQVTVTGKTSVQLMWSDDTVAELDLGSVVKATEFAEVRIGEWGHSLVWPSCAELGADLLWLETLSATGHDDARRFLEWRLRHGLSLSKAADALGISRRMVSYYSNAEKPVPKAILLACQGWEVGASVIKAA